MKLCDKCGNSLPADAAFCPVCGAAAGNPPYSPAGDEAAARPGAKAAAAPDTSSAQAQPAAPAGPAQQAAAAGETVSQAGAAAQGEANAPAGGGHVSFAGPDGAAPAAGDPPLGRGPVPGGGPRYASVAPQQPDGGLTTAQYFWTLLLFAIPLVGLVPMLYWSFGSAASPARRRLARASLIKTGILAIVGLIAAILLAFQVFRMRQSLLYGWYGAPYWYDDYYSDDYDDYYDGHYDDYYGGDGWPFDGWPFDLFGGSGGFGSGEGDGRIY